MVYITITFCFRIVKNNLYRAQLIRAQNKAAYGMQPLQSFLMWMPVAIAAAGRNKRQRRLHMLQKFQAAAVF